MELINKNSVLFISVDPETSAELVGHLPPTLWECVSGTQLTTKAREHSLARKPSHPCYVIGIYKTLSIIPDYFITTFKIIK